MLTNCQPAAYTPIGAYIKNESKAQARDALGKGLVSERQRAVVDILTAAQRHGVAGLTTKEVCHQYQLLTGKQKAPGDFTAAIDGLRAAKLIEFAGKRLNAETQKSADSWRLVAQQTRLAA